MRWRIIAMALLGFNSCLAAAEAPLVEKYLHSGQLARGEQVLEAALAEDSGDDQLRFSLAVLQLVRGVERLGQSLHEYGCLSGKYTPFRLPIPHNPDPSEITYPAFRRMLEGFRSDLATVELTLARVTDDDVSLPLRLAEIRLDMTGKGETNERFIEILKTLMGPDFHLPADNPDFLVRFDRGDVACLRSCCHMLMGMIDLGLAFDSEAGFNLSADQQFAKPKLRGTYAERWERQRLVRQVVKVVEPARLGHFRRHMLQVCELNRETWTFIRAEGDNDHEWLPNPKQTGVLKIPVTNEMIDAWLSTVSEVKDVFDGPKTIPDCVTQWLSPLTRKHMSLKAFLDDPPNEIDWARIRRDGIRDKYLDNAAPDVDIWVFVEAFQAFDVSLAVGYAAWFN